MFLVAGVTLSPAVSSLNHPVHPHHPILIHNCFSVFTFLYACIQKRWPMADGWWAACPGRVQQEPGGQQRSGRHGQLEQSCRSCPQCVSALGQAAGSCLWEALRTACVRQFENLYPTPLQNKDIIQACNYRGMLKYMFIMSVKEVFQNYVYSRTEGGC